MNGIPVNNPFIVGKYLSDKYFCDRTEETAFLRKQMQNGRDVALISPRRMGKSGLIQHFFNQEDIKVNYYVFYIDIYATTSLTEFVYTLGKEIYAQLKPQSTVWMEKFFQVISSFRIGGLGDIQTPQATLDEIFAYIEEADKTCIIAIDEFQQIGNYAEKNVEALLRTKIQQCHRAQFIFSGSKRHLMSNMFNSPSKPFYQSAITMGLEPLPLTIYTAFASSLFAESGKSIDAEVVATVWNQYNGYTWFVQMMMNELFALTAPHTRCSSELIPEAQRNVVLSQEGTFKDILYHLPPKQKIVLQAIAKEGLACNITSAKFIKLYRLPSSYF